MKRPDDTQELKEYAEMTDITIAHLCLPQGIADLAYQSQAKILFDGIRIVFQKTTTAPLEKTSC